MIKDKRRCLEELSKRIQMYISNKRKDNRNLKQETEDLSFEHCQGYLSNSNARLCVIGREGSRQLRFEFPIDKSKYVLR